MSVLQSAFGDADPLRMIFNTGAATPTSEGDLVQRCGLLADELEMGGANVAQMTASLREELGPTVIADALEDARSDSSVDLVQRFATSEADLTSSDLKGLGRVSTKGFPRLGGLLASEASRGAVFQVDLLHVVERSVHGTYLASLLAVPGLHAHAIRGDVEEIWQRWVPGAYSVPDNVFEGANALCAFEMFWERCFERWGMTKLRKQMRKQGSDIGRSLGGLAGVGVALAFAERSTPQAGSTTGLVT